MSAAGVSHRQRRGHGVGHLGLLPVVIVQQGQPIVRHQPDTQVPDHAAQQQLVIPQPGPQPGSFQLRVRKRQMQPPSPAYRQRQQEHVPLQRLVQAHALGRSALLQAPGDHVFSVCQQQLCQMYLPQIAAQNRNNWFHTHPPLRQSMRRAHKEEPRSLHYIVNARR